MKIADLAPLHHPQNPMNNEQHNAVASKAASAPHAVKSAAAVASKAASAAPHAVKSAAAVASKAASAAPQAVKSAAAVASKAASAAQKAVGSTVSSVVASRLYEKFETLPEDSLGYRLLSAPAYSGSDVERWLSLADATYNADSGAWVQIATDAERNLRVVGLLRDGCVELGFRGSVFVDDSGGSNLQNWSRVNA